MRAAPLSSGWASAMRSRRKEPGVFLLCSLGDVFPEVVISSLMTTLPGSLFSMVLVQNRLSYYFFPLHVMSAPEIVMATAIA